MSDRDKLIQDLKKNFGEYSIIKANQLPEWVVLPTGIAELDYQIGGGLHIGHFNFITGNKNVGKTYMCYRIITKFQSMGVSCYYVDLDRLFDESRAKHFGVDTNELVVISEGLTTEIVENIGKAIINSCNKSSDRRALVVLDSMAAMASDGTMETEAGKGYGTDDAKANNHLLKIWNSLANRNITFLVVQQFRDNLKMGEDNILPGGRAQEYYASNIIELKAGQTLKEGTLPIGQELKWTVKKTKTASPKQTGTVKFLYSSGVDAIESLILTAIEMEIIESAGAFYTVLGEKIRGKEKVIDLLKTNSEFLAKLESQVYAKMNTKIWDGEQIKVIDNGEAEIS